MSDKTAEECKEDTEAKRLVYSMRRVAQHIVAQAPQKVPSKMDFPNPLIHCAYCGQHGNKVAYHDRPATVEIVHRTTCVATHAETVLDIIGN